MQINRVILQVSKYRTVFRSVILTMSGVRGITHKIWTISKNSTHEIWQASKKPGNAMTGVRDTV